MPCRVELREPEAQGQVLSPHNPHPPAQRPPLTQLCPANPSMDAGAEGDTGISGRAVSHRALGHKATLPAFTQENLQGIRQQPGGFSHFYPAPVGRSMGQVGAPSLRVWGSGTLPFPGHSAHFSHVVPTPVTPPVRVHSAARCHLVHANRQASWGSTPGGDLCPGGA